MPQNSCHNFFENFDMNEVTFVRSLEAIEQSTTNSSNLDIATQNQSLFIVNNPHEFKNNGTIYSHQF